MEGPPRELRDEPRKAFRPGDEAYQFTRCGGEITHRVCIRIVRSTVIALIGYESIERRWLANLDQRDWDALQAALRRADFWGCSEWQPECVALDGFSWTIEGLRDGKCHQAGGQEPKDGPIFELGQLFQRLAGLPAPSRPDALAPGADEDYRSSHSSGRYGTSMLISRAGDRITIETRETHSKERWWGRQLDQAEWAAFKSAFERSNFWSMPEEFPQIGLDGATWMIEGRNGYRQHKSSCWGPSDPAFGEIGEFFVRLAGAELVYEQP